MLSDYEMNVNPISPSTKGHFEPTFQGGISSDAKQVKPDCLSHFMQDYLDLHPESLDIINHL